MSNFAHTLPFGAEIQPDGLTRFRIWAPSVPSLMLDRVAEPPVEMQSEGGWFTATVHAPPGMQYRYRLPDGTAVPDPASRRQAQDVHDPSVVVDPKQYVWQHGDWMGRPWHEAVVYEVHPGLMGGYMGIKDRLAELSVLGITVIELMPLSDFPGARNWGYDGVLPFAPDTAYGSPDELKALIDAAHGLGMMVLIDVVYNHFGPDGAYLHTYAKEFFDEGVHSLWGAAIDFKKPQVREYFIQNALYWIMEYRFDGLRMDAVQAISEESFLPEMAEAVRRAIEPGRHVHLTVEHDNNRATLLRQGFDAQWTDDFHHSMHVLLTDETEGYYEDFEEGTTHLARVLSEGFAYQGEHSKHADRPRGEPSSDLPPTAFVICLQNHDQTGNRANGERLTVLTSPDKLEAATTLMLLSPFIPMLFMGEEYGATNPFLFFTSHGETLADLVRAGRREEFKHFAAFKDESRREQIPDPNAQSTFDASIPDRRDPERFRFIQNLLQTRRDHITPGIPGCVSEGAKAIGPKHIRAAWKLGTGSRLMIEIDLSDEPHITQADGTVLMQTPRVLVQLAA